MTSTHTCLWCRNTLLRHVRRSGVYWFCNSCRQEIHPLLLDLGQTQRVSDPLQRPSTLEEAVFEGAGFDDVVEVKIALPISATAVDAPDQAEADLPPRSALLQGHEAADAQPSLSVYSSRSID